MPQSLLQIYHSVILQSACLRAWNESELANFENPVYSVIQQWKRMLMKCLQRKQVSPFVISNFVIVANGVTGGRFWISQIQYKYFYENIHRKFSNWFSWLSSDFTIHFTTDGILLLMAEFFHPYGTSNCYKNQLSKVFKVHTLGVGGCKSQVFPERQGKRRIVTQYKCYIPI